MIQFQENTQTAGRKDGQTLFDRILLATGGALTSTTTMDWYLKVKDIEYDAGLTKNYCIKLIIVSVQLIHSFLRYSRF